MAVMPRPTLLVLASTFPARPGDGTPAFVRDLALGEAGAYQTTVLVPAVPGGAPREHDGPLEIVRFRYFPRRWEDLAHGAILENVRSRPSRLLQVPALLAAEYLAVRREVRRRRPDVLHVHWLIPQGLVALAAARGIPKLVTTLGGDLYGLRDPLSRKIIRAVVGDAKAVTTMNAEMRDRLLALGADPASTHVMPMGADLDAIRPVAAAATPVPGRVLFVGRLVEKKGLTHLLRALSSLSTTPAAGDVHLRVVGDGPLRDRVHRQAAGLPVEFLGGLARNELSREYGTAQVAVFPSVPAASGDQDGLPVALLEAMGCGCPVIASRLPGLDEAVEDGVSGLLVTPGDADQLAGALRRLLEDEPLRRRLSEGAVQRAQGFSSAATAAAYIRLLDSVRGAQPDG
jgi:glycosyltransferase involved in cell wall biosynthesis